METEADMEQTEDYGAGMARLLTDYEKRWKLRIVAPVPPRHIVVETRLADRDIPEGPPPDLDDDDDDEIFDRLLSRQTRDGAS